MPRCLPWLQDAIPGEPQRAWQKRANPVLIELILLNDGFFYRLRAVGILLATRKKPANLRRDAAACPVHATLGGCKKSSRRSAQQEIIRFRWPLCFSRFRSCARTMKKRLIYSSADLESWSRVEFCASRLANGGSAFQDVRQSHGDGANRNQ